jgi:hypothetical protein
LVFANRIFTFIAVLMATLTIVSCQSSGQPPTSTPASLPTQPAQSVPEIQLSPHSFGYTHVRADGNRYAQGKGSLSPDSRPIDVKLAGKPVWVAGAPIEDGTIWAVVTDEGQTQIVQASRERVNVFAPVSSGSPPLLVNDGEPKLLGPPGPTASRLTHPVPLLKSDRVAFVNNEGDVVIRGDTEIARFKVNALPDARLLVDDNDRLLVLSGRTGRYPHGVVGDRIEASSITLIETVPEPKIVNTIEIQDGKVIEGISPIWTDIDGDGAREIIVTLSDSSQGAQVVVFREDGELLAEGQPVGQGGRWRHQIAAAPFGPNGEMEIVDVRTPHIGGIVEFYQLDGGNLNIVAQTSGYTSHLIGSRNLDMAAAADFDGDGQVELLLPGESFTELGAIRRTSAPEGAEVAWTIPLGGRMTSNLAGVPLPDDGIAVGVGREDDILRLWLPD